MSTLFLNLKRVDKSNLRKQIRGFLALLLKCLLLIGATGFSLPGSHAQECSYRKYFGVDGLGPLARPNWLILNNACRAPSSYTPANETMMSNLSDPVSSLHLFPPVNPSIPVMCRTEAFGKDYPEQFNSLLDWLLGRKASFGDMTLPSAGCTSAFVDLLTKAGIKGTSSSAQSGQVGNTQLAPSQSQAAQQQSAQTQQYAQQVTARTDQARQGKRKTHDPAEEAHQCIGLDQDPRVFGAFTNSCNFKVSFYSCNYRPKTIPGGFNWSADFDCEKQKFGLYDAGAGGTVAAHNHNTETVYFFACKAPATPTDVEFVAGKGAMGRCFK